MHRRVVWITGASSGIGRALAIRMARQGWTVAASARRTDLLDTLVKEFRAEGVEGMGTISAFPVDVTDVSTVTNVVRAVEKGLGEIETVVLAAGTHIPTDPSQFDIQDVRDIFELNVMGVMNCVSATLPGFIDRKKGRLAIVSSVAGYRGLPTASAYGASKAALINFSEALRVDLAPYNIVVQLISPGFVRTPLTDKNEFPMPFLMEVEDAAASILKGLETDRFEISFPKQFVVLLKLLRLLPYWAYFKLVRFQTGK